MSDIRDEHSNKALAYPHPFPYHTALLANIIGGIARLETSTMSYVSSRDAGTSPDPDGDLQQGAESWHKKDGADEVALGDTVML